MPFLSEFSAHDPYFQWILIAMAVVTLFYAVVRPAMKKNKDPLAKTPAMSSLAQQRNVERQMQNLLVELSEMTRQISSQLDTRAQKLQMLIVDADERIAELKKLQNQPAKAPAPEPWRSRPPRCRATFRFPIPSMISTGQSTPCQIRANRRRHRQRTVASAR